MEYPSRYDESPEKVRGVYASTEAEERLQHHIEAVQQLSAIPAYTYTTSARKQDNQNEIPDKNSTDATQHSTKTYDELDEKEINYVRVSSGYPFLASKRENVAATCITCLSPSSLVQCNDNLFCSTCNMSALKPHTI